MICRAAQAIFYVALATTVLAISAAADTPAQQVLLDIVRFDPGIADFYWYGHHLQPPVVISWDGEQMLANGIPPSPPPLDTTGSSARLARQFANTPFIDSLAKESHSYVTALNDYGCLVQRAALDAVRAHRMTDRTTPPAARRSVALKNLDPRLYDHNHDVIVSDSTFACVMVTGGTYSITYPMRLKLSGIAPPCTKQPPPPDLIPRLRESLTILKNAFRPGRNVVVLAQQNGHRAYSGTEADRARSEIAAARAAVTRGEQIKSTTALPSRTLIPRQLLAQIACN